MISIIHLGDHRYAVYRSGFPIGCGTVSQNPYHTQHCYLTLELDTYDPDISRELFALLRAELGCPLQVMLYSTQETFDFLTAGGFARRRRCYEVEASPSDLAAPVQPVTPLTIVQKGSPEYDACCQLLYEYYSETHRAVSPLTATLETFCAALPETVLCRMEDGKPVHFAFIEPDDKGCEIAYVGSTRPSCFPAFAQTLVHSLFQKYDSISMECDDCDPAAMAIKALFNLPDGDSYDTYILE